MKRKITKKVTTIKDLTEAVNKTLYGNTMAENSITFKVINENENALTIEEIMEDFFENSNPQVTFYDIMRENDKAVYILVDADEGRVNATLRLINRFKKEVSTSPDVKGVAVRRTDGDNTFIIVVYKNAVETNTSSVEVVD